MVKKLLFMLVALCSMRTVYCPDWGTQKVTGEKLPYVWGGGSISGISSRA